MRGPTSRGRVAERLTRAPRAAGRGEGLRTLVIATLLVTAGFLAAPVASACPDPDNPCDPPPYDPFEGCPHGGGPLGPAKSLVACAQEWLP